jgi:hypothetical protein
MAKIAWEHPPADGAMKDHLVADVREHVVAGMRIDEDGDYVISFVVVIDGNRRTLQQVETFVDRVAEFIEDEPVPGDED